METAISQTAVKNIVSVALADIQPSNYNPRKNFDEKSLAELADSIRQQGVLQAIGVRPIAENRFEIVFGERRYRASQIAGLEEIPAVILDISDETAEEMAEHFNFTADQRQQLSELLAEENRSMWSAVLYGIYFGDDSIVTVALSQIGNVGGQPYWSWYGFESRVEWCACFVSWCANECGYIDGGVIPKFAGCVNGVQWFKDRGQWQDGSFEPSAGQIIFFDWDNKGSSGPQDGQSDHVGIVEKCENGIVYTIEGNSGDSCRQNQYPVGHYEILGYGIPAF